MSYEDEEVVDFLERHVEGIYWALLGWSLSEALERAFALQTPVVTAAQKE
jgi:hypothetical protein